MGLTHVIQSIVREIAAEDLRFSFPFPLASHDRIRAGLEQHRLHRRVFSIEISSRSLEPFQIVDPCWSWDRLAHLRAFRVPVLRLVELSNVGHDLLSMNIDLSIVAGTKLPRTSLSFVSLRSLYLNSPDAELKFTWNLPSLRQLGLGHGANQFLSSFAGSRRVISHMLRDRY